MIFGGGKLQLSLIRKAKSLGLITVVVDPDAYAPGLKMADAGIVVGANDETLTNEIVRKYNCRAVVTTATDKPLGMMARIAEKNGMIFPVISAIVNGTNKFIMKQVLKKHDLPHANGILYDAACNAPEDLDKVISFPVVVKPIDNSGSRGVYFCPNKNQLDYLIKQSLEYSKSGKILIEEYVSGNEISVEAMVQDGQVYYVQFTDKITTKLPYNVELGHTQPSVIGMTQRQKVEEIITCAVKALGFDQCGVHAELKLSAKGPVIIEISPRLGGDFITSELVTLSTGIEMESELLKMSLGRKIDVAPKLFASSAIRYLNFPEKKISVIDQNLQERLQGAGICKFQLDLRPGDSVHKITNSLNRYGYYILRAENREKLFDKIGLIDSIISSSMSYC